MRLLTSTLVLAALWAAFPAAARADEEGRFIRGLYREILNRNVEARYVQEWKDLMYDNGWSRREVRARFLASDELFEKAEQDRSRLIRMLFKHVAGRAPNRGEVNMWLRHWNENYGEDRLAMVRAFQKAVRDNR